MTRLIVLLQCIYGIFYLFSPLSGTCVQMTEDGKTVGICSGIYITDLNDMNGVEETVQVLRIDNVTFANAILHARNFTNFKHLEGLSIKNSRITKIHKNTFNGLHRLKYIDLSRNEIDEISPMAFNGVTLNDLYLNNNPGLRLYDESFSGATIGHLSMNGCNLTKIDYSVIKRGHIRNLTLSNNRLTKLDVAFKEMLRSTRNNDWGFIDLTENPLICDCHLTWLSELMLRQEKEYQKNPYPIDEKRLTFKLSFMCHEPRQLKGLRLPLDKETLCPMPKIVGVLLDIITLNPLLVNLQCTSKSNAPSTVIMINSSGYRISSSDPINTRVISDEDQDYYITSSQVNLTLPNLKHEELKCMVSNEKRRGFENSHDLILNGDDPVQWSSLKINLKNLVKEAIHQQQQQQQSYPLVSENVPDNAQSNSLFVKRYTLLELIGSIIGTFIGTLLFLYCISRCLPIIFKTKHFAKRIPSPGGSSDDYLKTSKTLLISSGNNNGHLFSSPNDANLFQGQFNPLNNNGQQQENLQNIINQMNIQKNPQYWQSPEYVYSSTTPGPEYDVPRLTNFPPTHDVGQLSSTLSRRNLFSSNTPIMGSPFIIPNQPHNNINAGTLFNQSQLLNAANFYNLHPGNFQGTLSNVTMLRGAVNDDERFRNKPRNNSHSPISASSGSK